MKGKRLSAVFLGLLLIAEAFIGSAVFAEDVKLTSPSAFFGFKPGTSKNLCTWPDIKNYLQLLDKESKRVVYEDIGSTTLGDREIMAIVSSEDNIANLDYYKQVQSKLADPRGLSEKDLRALKSEAKAVMLVGASIHSTEIGGLHAVLNAIYTYASTEDKDLEKILDNVILLFVPSLNPDGHVMTVNWYKQTLGTKYEGSNPPYLYHYYVGHDDNRDWFMFNLSESRNVGEVLYTEWFPEVVYDIHQMGSNGARLFVPPFFDPPNPEIPPIIFREITTLGGVATTDLSAKGMTGVVTDAVYDTWWHGGMRSGPYYHNMVGLLTETASAKIATSLDIPFEKLTGKTRGLENAQTFTQTFTEPWKGGLWTFEDVVAYPESVIYSYAKTLSKLKEDFVSNFVKMGQDAIRKGLTESPSAFILPADPSDPATLNWMLEILNFQGTEIHRATAPFVADGKPYPEGTYVILAAQQYRPNVMALLDKQVYPNRLQYTGGPAEAPYDVAGWTLPMEMGVECIKVDKPFDANLELVKVFKPVPGAIVKGSAGYGYAFRPEANNSATVRSKLLAAGFKLKWLMDPEVIGGIEFPAGTTIVLSQDGLTAKLADIASKYSTTFYPMPYTPTSRMTTLSNPRVGIYENWGGNADAGWTRMVFDKFEIPYTFMRDADIKEGKLIDKYDAIVLPDTSTDSLKKGLAAGTYPDEYTGGVGDEGLANLKEFVNAGGTIILCDSIFDFATTILDAPVKNVLSGVDSSKFYCPGSVLDAKIVDKTSPVTFGMDEKFGAYFVQSPTFDVTGSNAKVLATYPADRNPLMSGWLMGPEYIQGKANLVEYCYGNGRAILIGMRVQHRGQTHGTFKLLFNSIFYAAAK